MIWFFVTLDEVDLSFNASREDRRLRLFSSF